MSFSWSEGYELGMMWVRFGRDICFWFFLGSDFLSIKVHLIFGCFGCLVVSTKLTDWQIIPKQGWTSVKKQTNLNLLPKLKKKVHHRSFQYSSKQIYINIQTLYYPIQCSPILSMDLSLRVPAFRRISEWNKRTEGVGASVSVGRFDQLSKELLKHNVKVEMYSWATKKTLLLSIILVV